MQPRSYEPFLANTRSPDPSEVINQHARILDETGHIALGDIAVNGDTVQLIDSNPTVIRFNGAVVNAFFGKNSPVGRLSTQAVVYGDYPGSLGKLRVGYLFNDHAA